ncbi:RluA family pseudouridine synthase [Rickettsiales endosymbiont of Stachyamoeba lipophora]|uniref:RluA family pseudouridine synthase n=1 Tax=Rickettsiales endosymbiont of Stachyamoeba lipophora TaxID=2486578 RepID=UPI000F650C38|nr:RluA family pseudouridine synthase [Rickettsiales endosymbiont of Stachyamoeba lipophora]AZL15236.1 RluA family pseudouridine synthase [Rickettsiales endosymbiont of Stachyamoeba lipophora]
MQFEILTVQSHEANQRIDRYLRKTLPHLNQINIEQALRKGLIKLNAAKVVAKDHIKENDQIAVAEFLAKEDASKPVKSKLNLPEKKLKFWLEQVLYKDKDIIIINKPIGVAVQGGTGITQSIDDLLEIYQEGYPERPKLVHRLDKETSGVLILARTREVATNLTQLFKAKEVQKVYLAVVVGDIRGSGFIKQPIIDKETGQSKAAHTEYQVLDYLKGCISLVEFMPSTGRKHQLRIHAAHSLDAPILADFEYGRELAYVEGFGNKLHLHARKIAFSLNGKQIEVTAPLPDHFKETFRIAGFNYENN